MELMKRKVGHPKMPAELVTQNVIRFRIFKDEEIYLRQQSEIQRCSMSEIIRRLIRKEMGIYDNGKT